MTSRFASVLCWVQPALTAPTLAARAVWSQDGPPVPCHSLWARITYQVIFFGDLQQQGLVASVVGQNGLHLLLVFQTNASNHRPLAVEHFDHLVLKQLKVDKRPGRLGVLPFEGLEEGWTHVSPLLATTGMLPYLDKEATGKPD